MSKTRKVGNLHTHEDSKGFTYVQTYFVDSVDEATYTPTYGQAGNAAPFDFPVNTFVYDWDKTPAADQFEIIIKCHNDGYGESTGLDGFTSPDDAQRRFNMKDLYFDPTWWGARRATKADTGEFKTEDGAITPSTPKLNIYGASCKEGDWLFRGADEATAGAADFAQSPYTTASMATVDATKFLGTTVKTLTYAVLFYTNKDIMTFLNWVGVNGAGNTFFSPPNGCIPTGVTGEAEWKATGTQVIENARDFDGTLYHSVSRSMELAPNTLVWDKTKLGGIWTW